MASGFALRLALCAALGASAVACTDLGSAGDEEAASDDTLRESLSGQESAFDVDAFPSRAQWIDTYGSVPAGCVAQHDDLHGTRALFHGCYDWHSSVHAHWAVYRASLAGSGRVRTLARGVDARITADEVAKVATELESDHSFENPYGRAWLLHLATEHATWNQRQGTPSRRLRALGDRTAKTLLDDLTTFGPDRLSADYRSDAWALAQVLLYGRATSQPAITDAATRLIRSTFAAQPVRWDEANDDDPSAFMSTYWSSVYVLALALPARELVELIPPQDIPDDALTPLPDPGVATDVHHLGVNWSRAWAIKALARRAKEALGATDAQTQRLVRAYHAHVHAGRERHFRYRGNYYAYDHWVPQFAVYAITDGAR